MLWTRQYGGRVTSPQPALSLMLLPSVHHRYYRYYWCHNRYYWCHRWYRSHRAIGGTAIIPGGITPPPSWDNHLLI